MRPARPPAALAVVLSAAALALGAAARERRDAGQEQAPTLFRTGVDLVRLDVRVTDADGSPIRDLRADEVEVFEAGQRRPVVLFQRVTQPPGTYDEAAQRTVASEVSTNQGAPRGNVYVLIFDQTHITAGNEQRARRAAERFLARRVRPGDRVALYAIPGPGPQIGFTADVARAARELESVRGSRDDQQVGAVASLRVYDAYEIARGNQEVLGRYVLRLQEHATASDVTVAATSRRPAGREPDSPAELRRLLQEDARQVVSRADGDSRRFLQQLAAVVDTLREVDGRKAVVLFSEGFAIDNVRQELEEVAAAAARASGVIYAADLNPRGVDMGQALPREVAAGTEILNNLESLGSLAGETDGVLFHDAAADVDRVLDRIAEAAQDYYLVGFAPGPEAARDRRAYRRVRVVLRRPGARVSARSGYSLTPVPGPSDRRRALDAALTAPFAQQGLRVEYTTYVLAGTAPGAQRVFLSLAAELPLAGTDAARADVVFAVRHVRTGRLAASGAGEIELPESTVRDGSSGVGTYQVQFDLPAGVYLMRAVVREPGGLLGSADRRFEVRTLGGPGITAGDLILGARRTRGLPVRADAHVADGLAGVLEVYARAPGPLDDVVVDVELLPAGGLTAALRVRADLQPTRIGGRGASREARLAVPLTGVQPGEYIARATVRAGRETAAEVLRDVSIRPGSAPEPTSPPPGTPAARPDPSVVVRGDVVRRWVATLGERVPDRSVQEATGAASRGEWADAEHLTAGLPASLAEATAVRGLARLATGDPWGAAERLAAYANARPEDAVGAFVLGWAHAGTGDDRAAVSAWRAAIVADPTLVPAYLAAISAYLRLGEPALARQVAGAGVAALPDSPELREALLRLDTRRPQGGAGHMDAGESARTERIAGA